jgi:hypothetical protein
MCDILKSQSLSSALVTRRFLGYESIRYRTDALITANGNLHFRVLTRVSELNLNSQVSPQNWTWFFVLVPIETTPRLRPSPLPCQASGQLLNRSLVIVLDIQLPPSRDSTLILSALCVGVCIKIVLSGSKAAIKRNIGRPTLPQNFPTAILSYMRSALTDKL